MEPTIKLIKVTDGRLTIFTSALQKEEFIKTHKKGTYEILGNGNAATEHLYMIIDTEGTGFALTRHGVTYNESIELIKHYI